MLRRGFLFLALALPAGARAPQPSFKGMELYSFRRDSGWRFALLIGTNRNKTWPEVEAAGVPEATLGPRLADLAVGEQIFWGERMEQVTRDERGLPLERASSPLSFPDEDTIRRIQALCSRLQLDLVLLR